MIQTKNHKIDTEFDLKNLPSELKISTMTITCNLNSKIDIQNVSKYIDLSFGNIVCIKADSVIRTLIKLKRKNKNKNSKKKPNECFHNQATLIIEVGNKKTINTKVFKNGAIQMTGCKSIEDLIISLKVLCQELQKKKAIYDKDLKQIIRRPFVSDHGNVNIESICNFKIRMINSNFHIDFLINRENLFELLKKKNIQCIYEPCIHACVNIKYNYKNQDTVSIFVFESGSIIITGAKNRQHIISAYEFITKILYENYEKIVKNNIDVFLEREDIKQLIENMENIETAY